MGVQLARPTAPADPASSKRVFSRPEAAGFCGLSLSSFDRAVRRGDLPRPIRIGRRALWCVASLDAALDRLAAQSK
jgi:predicted DNA-binding transcriptional regulator AlpA